jgi:hypothetical protein
VEHMVFFKLRMPLGAGQFTLHRCLLYSILSPIFVSDYPRSFLSSNVCFTVSMLAQGCKSCRFKGSTLRFSCAHPYICVCLKIRTSKSNDLSISIIRCPSNVAIDWGIQLMFRPKSMVHCLVTLVVDERCFFYF